MPTTPLSVPIDTGLQHRLEAEARRTQRSVAQVAEQAFDFYLAAVEVKRDAIRAALERADAGDFVEGGDVRAWLESWDSDEELPKPLGKRAGAAV